MTTTMDLANGPAKAAPSRMTLRLAALLIAHEGALPHAFALELAEAARTGAKKPAKVVADAMRPLVYDGVVLRHEDTWYAPSLADVAGWLADGLEYREDAGIAADPVLPADVRPRIPAQATGPRVQEPVAA